MHVLRLVTVSALSAGLVACASTGTTASAADDPTVTAQEELLVENFIQFARAPGPETSAAVPFAQEVWLGLADELLVGRLVEELAEPSAWVVEGPPRGFRERTGPFSALDMLARAGEIRLSVGPHRACGSRSRFVSPPEAVAQLRHLSVQPAEPLDCTRWWGVDLFINADGEIAAVTLDFGAP